MIGRFLFVFSALFLISPMACADEDPRLAPARQLFDQYVTAEKNFDIASAKLYANNAEICNWRKSSSGDLQKRCIEAPAYKAMIVKFMPLAKEKGDSNTYSDVTFTPYHSKEVHIKAMRYNVLKGYSSPFEMIVGPDPEGHWLITREYSVSQP